MTLCNSQLIITTSNSKQQINTDFVSLLTLIKVFLTCPQSSYTNIF